jgi:hypothetical protein
MRYQVNFHRYLGSMVESSGPFSLREDAEKCALGYAALGFQVSIVEIR